ncbi:MAG: MFS transporter [Planctomycetota bacterium]
MTSTALPAPAPPMSGGLNVRLSLMMFLQYAIWGAWLPFLYDYLANSLEFTGAQIGQVFAAAAVGAILGPAIAGPIADRFVHTERLLGVSHILGAGLIWQLSRTEDYQTFLILALVYGFIYMPTLSLTNALSFAHVPDRDRDFGRVRLWGTLGWIAVGLVMGHWLANVHSPEGSDAALASALAAGKVDGFKLSALLGAAMGLYCFTLPATPPTRSAESNPALRAVKEVRYQPLLTLFLVAVPVSCIHQFYFVYAEGFISGRITELPGWMKSVFGAGGGGLMTIGQMSEILVLGLIPLVARRVPRKVLLMVGLTAYAARMALFAYVDSLPVPVGAALIAGIALHGLCFGCFIFVAYMIVDEETTADVRASAQNLFNLVIVGVGIIVGSMVATAIGEWAKGGTDVTDFRALFSVPMYAALACLVVILALYPLRGGRRDELAA